jgi:hypothetical protein
MLQLGLTTYRPEALGYSTELMRGFSEVALEEPVTPGFADMLSGRLAIETYLQLTDFGFAEYARLSCQKMRELSANGLVFRQIDPFMDELVRIHEFFASGGRPDQISESVTARVYAAEKVWTARLLDFYSQSIKGGFAEVVQAVQTFAQADAARGALRDEMRAKALADRYSGAAKVYIEAGYIHLSLLSALLTKGLRPKVTYVLEPVYKQLCGLRQVLGPGDKLTWLYTRRPGAEGARPALLAAQALVYNKIVTKQEMVGTSQGHTPHAEDEVEAVSMVEDLDISTCRYLFDEIRFLPSLEARRLVSGFLDQ